MGECKIIRQVVLVLFCDACNRRLRRLLSWPSHCEVFVLSDDGLTWCGLSYTPAGLVLVADVDLAATYRQATEGGRRAELWIGETSRKLDTERLGWGWLNPITCVGVVKSVLGLRKPLVLTPFEVYEEVRRSGFTYVPPEFLEEKTDDPLTAEATGAP